MAKEIPYKIYLEENEMPTQWYNVRADMKKKPAHDLPLQEETACLILFHKHNLKYHSVYTA